MSKAMPNLNQFKKGLRFASKDFPDKVKKQQSDIAGRIYSGILLKTPVLTGHARHNWMPSLNDPHIGELEGVYGGDTTGDAFTDTEVMKMQRVQRQIEQGELGQTIYISNSAPYIERLEHGYSAKAPSGMVEVTVLEVLEDIKDRQVILNDRRD